MDNALISAAHAIGGFCNHRQLSLAERCRAAAEGGFRAIGWALDDYRAERSAGRSDADILAILADHGVAVPEVEYLEVGAEAATGGTAGQDRRDLLHLAALVQARHLVCVAPTASGLSPDQETRMRIVRDYRSLCEDAATVGVMPLLEAMPWSILASLAAAAEVVEMAGHSSGGLVLDTWHFHRIGSAPEDLCTVPADMVRLVQISDAGPMVGDFFEDTVKRRLFPGEGEFPLVETLRVAARHGVRAPVSVEVIGDAADRLTPSGVARRSLETTQAVLQAAGFDPVG